MSLWVEQSCEHEGDGWWRWAVWLSGDELGNVNAVEYTLHPTFPQPHVVTQDRDSAFRIERTGWGEFRIYLKVHLGGGATRELDHWLRLPADSGVEAPTRGLPEPPPAPTRGGAPSPDEAYSAPADAAPKRVFLSASVADADLAEAVREHLLADGIEVASIDSAVPAGTTWEAGVKDALRDTDGAFVLLDPKRASLWTLREAELARDASVPVVPVLLGDTEGRGLPDWMRSLETIRADRSDSWQLAQTISGLLKARD